MNEIIHLGAWGKTIFGVRPAMGLEGDHLVLRTREGAIEIGCQELQAIAALACAFNLEPDNRTVQCMRDRLGAPRKNPHTPQ